MVKRLIAARAPALVLLGSVALAVVAPAAAAFHPIAATDSAAPVVLTGRTLSIDDIVRVARDGAQVSLSAAAQQAEDDQFGLLLEAAAEGVPVYWFNRGVGDQRETVMFEGDPLAAANRARIEQQQLRRFVQGATEGTGPEVEDEDVVRAMMVVRANGMVWNAPSRPLSQMLIDLLNRRVTPVVQSRGTLGEADLAQLGNVGATMVGAGEAYYRGERLPAAEALRRAGLHPIRPFGADDNALTSSNAYATGQAALLVHDARRALEWADLVYALDLNGMNSSVTPLSLVVQRDRPEPWLNWHAAKILGLVRGSYLFDADPHRIIQDPESLRASSIRQASAWEEWGALRDAVTFQVNSSDHNPAVRIDLGPEDSWELASAQMLRFYVKGGPLSHGRHGYVVSNANWDPYPLANRLESFVIALGNMDVAVALRIERFRNPFFTGVEAGALLPGATAGDFGYAPVDLMQEIQTLMAPVAPSGSAIVGTVEDLQSQTRLKVERARHAVDATLDLLGFDLLQAALWLDVRHREDPARAFGATPTALWRALRERVPLGAAATDPRPVSDWSRAAQFLRSAAPATFQGASEPPGGSAPR